MCHACMSWVDEAYRFSSLEVDGCVRVVPGVKCCPLDKWKAGPLGLQRRDHLFGSFLAVAVLSAVMLFF